jgi:hypothetical protein
MAGYDTMFGFDTTQKQTLENLLNSVDGAASIAALQTSVTNLNAWATALATKLNADAGVTDTNYDTNPQA